MIIPNSNFTQKYNFECKTSDQISENNTSSNKTFLKNAKRTNNKVFTKSGIMVGLGEE